MRLRDLEAKFLKWEKRAVPPDQWVDDILSPSGFQVTLPWADSLAEAHGIMFLCPKCFDGDHHSVICWFEGRVPDEAQPGPGRWNPTGTGIDDLSFVPGSKSNSVLLLGGCAWHGFVTNGDAT